MAFYRAIFIIIIIIIIRVKTRHQVTRLLKSSCPVSRLPPSYPETDEPQCNRNNPLLAAKVLSAYLDA